MRMFSRLTKKSMTPPKNRIALLRGINVSGRHQVRMEELRAVCAELAWASVETCLQTGNIVFASDQSTVSLEAELEAAIESHFNFAVPVLCRTLQDFEGILNDSPFRETAKDDPSHVILYLSKHSVQDSAQAELQGKASTGERVRAFANALWIYFPNGIGRSKLTPAVIDKAVGSAATGRNWKTAWKIRELASV